MVQRESNLETLEKKFSFEFVRLESNYFLIEDLEEREGRRTYLWKKVSEREWCASIGGSFGFIR